MGFPQQGQQCAIDWPKIHDMFKPRDANTWQRKFPIGFPLGDFRVEFLPWICYSSTFSRYFCSYGKQVINWSKTSLIALLIRSILPRWKTALTLKRNFPAQNRTNWQSNNTYRKTSDIRHTLVDNKIVDHSDVVRASPVGTAPTASSFSTWHLASRDSAKKATRQYENILSVRIWCV